MAHPELDALVAATNARDLAALVECFADNYSAEFPQHPGRAFRGRGQVGRNWRAFFSAVPNLRVQILRSCAAGDEVWAEWRQWGTRQDGGRHEIVGVTIFGTSGGKIDWARIYLEPVLPDGVGTADAATSGRR